MAKLTDRQAVLLKIIDDATQRDDSNDLARYFVPQPGLKLYYLTFRGKRLDTAISGAGDANSLKALERKGLIERPKNCPLGRYCYAITEDGRLAIEAVRNLFDDQPIQLEDRP